MNYPVADFFRNADVLYLFNVVLTNCGFGRVVKDDLLRSLDESTIIDYGYAWVHKAGALMDSTSSDFEDALIDASFGNMDNYESYLKDSFGNMWDDIDTRFGTACREFHDACDEFAWVSVTTWR